MATLAELQTRLDALRKARAGPARVVQGSDGKRIEYKSDDELAAAIADVERQIAAASNTPIRTVYLTSSKGI